MQVGGGLCWRMSLYFLDVSVFVAIVYNSLRSICSLFSLLNGEQDKGVFSPLSSLYFLWEKAFWGLLLHCCATWALNRTIQLLPHFVVRIFFLFGYLGGVILSSFLFWLLFVPVAKKNATKEAFKIFVHLSYFPPCLLFSVWTFYDFSSIETTAHYSCTDISVWWIKDVYSRHLSCSRFSFYQITSS